MRGPYPRHCARATQLLLKKGCCGGDLIGRGLNLRPPLTETNAVPFYQLAAVVQSSCVIDVKLVLVNFGNPLRNSKMIFLFFIVPLLCESCEISSLKTIRRIIFFFILFAVSTRYLDGAWSIEALHQKVSISELNNNPVYKKLC